jgi:superfamily II DNA/RNA helicase
MTEKANSRLNIWLWVVCLPPPLQDRTPVIHQREGWVGVRAGLYACDGDIFLLLQGIEPRFLDRPHPNNVRRKKEREREEEEEEKKRKEKKRKRKEKKKKEKGEKQKKRERESERRKEKKRKKKKKKKEGKKRKNLKILIILFLPSCHPFYVRSRY